MLMWTILAVYTLLTYVNIFSPPVCFMCCSLRLWCRYPCRTRGALDGTDTQVEHLGWDYLMMLYVNY